MAKHQYDEAIREVASHIKETLVVASDALSDQNNERLIHEASRLINLATDLYSLAAGASHGGVIIGAKSLNTMLAGLNRAKPMAANERDLVALVEQAIDVTKTRARRLGLPTTLNLEA